MKKQALSLLLALSLMSVPALAKENSADNFVRGKTYAGQFSDLPEDHTFYENVAALYEYGLSVGQADGTYGLTVPMTVGQSVIFAGRIRSLYRTGDPEAGPAAFTAAAIGLKDAQRVYAPYLWYLQAEGVLDKALDEQLANVATRAQMAHVLANLLPETVLPPVNDSLITQAYASRRRITDVTEYTPYYNDILKLRDQRGQRRDRLLSAGFSHHQRGRRSHADPDGGSLPSADAGLAPAGALQRRGGRLRGSGHGGNLHRRPRDCGGL